MSEWIFGVNAVRSALETGRLKRVFYAGDQSRIKKLIEEAKNTGIACEVSSHRQLERLAKGRRSQGVGGEITPYPYASLEIVLAGEGPVVALDGVEDVGNLGAILRSAYALGAAGVVLPKNNAAAVTPQTERTSAGAASKLAIARVTNLGRALDQAKQQGRWVFGASMEGETSVDDLDFAESCVLVLGGEGTGIRHQIKNRCDVLFHLPMVRNFESLNVSVSAALSLDACRRFRTKS